MEDESFRQGRESAPIDNTGAPFTSMTLEGFGEPLLHLSVCLSALDVIALTDYVHAIVLAEREACAKVCDDVAGKRLPNGEPSAYWLGASKCALLIKRRTPQPPAEPEPQTSQSAATPRR